MILKIGITPSNAPFRIACLRTFLYIYAIAEKNAIIGGKSKIIFQIDNTNSECRLHSDEEIIDFYKKLQIIPSKNSDIVITTQKDIIDKCDLYFDKLSKLGLIIEDELTKVYAFNIKKYKELYGNLINVNDVVNGEIEYNVENLTKSGIINIKRSDGSYLYNFSAAVDTIYWGFTDLIRGNNKITSAAFQNMFIKALGYKCPNYFHLPLLLEEKNNNGVNARDDFRDLLKNDISYMPALNYILSTGYGDNTDFYSSLDDFYKKFDVNKLHKNNAQFDHNILKKTNNRYFQNELSYDDYYKQLKTHIELLNLPNEILKYSQIGYLNKLNNSKVIQLYNQMNSKEHFDNMLEGETEEVIKLIDSLSANYDETIEKILINKETKKQNLRLVKWILCGIKDGLSCDVYRQCYNDVEYQNRLKYVRSIVCR